MLRGNSLALNILENKIVLNITSEKISKVNLLNFHFMKLEKTVN